MRTVAESRPIPRAVLETRLTFFERLDRFLDGFAKLFSLLIVRVKRNPSRCLTPKSKTNIYARARETGFSLVVA